MNNWSLKSSTLKCKPWWCFYSPPFRNACNWMGNIHLISKKGERGTSCSITIAAETHTRCMHTQVNLDCTSLVVNSMHYIYRFHGTRLGGAWWPRGLAPGSPRKLKESACNQPIDSSPLQSHKHAHLIFHPWCRLSLVNDYGNSHLLNPAVNNNYVILFVLHVVDNSHSKDRLKCANCFIHN